MKVSKKYQGDVRKWNYMLNMWVTLSLKICVLKFHFPAHQFMGLNIATKPK